MWMRPKSDLPRLMPLRSGLLGRIFPGWSEFWKIRMKQLAPFSSYPLPYKYLFLFLLILHLLPIWIFRYFPSQDGMNHVYNAYILKSYHDPALYNNLTLFPNWISHLLMAGLMFIVLPLIVEKLLLLRHGWCPFGLPLFFT